MYKLLQPDSGISSKRFISVFGFIVLVFIALVDLFSNFTVSDYVYEGLVFVILGGLGSTAAEAFSKRNNYRGNTNYINDIGPDTYINQNNPNFNQHQRPLKGKADQEESEEEK